MNPDNVHCFGTVYIPESEICFCINLCCPSSPHTIWPVLKLLNCQTMRWVLLGSSQLGATKNRVYEMTWYLYTRGVHRRINAKQHWFKITVSWMVSSCMASCSWWLLHWRIHHSHLTSTQFHSLVPWWRQRRIQPQKTRLSQSENSAMGTWPIYKNFCASLVWKMA